MLGWGWLREFCLFFGGPGFPHLPKAVGQGVRLRVGAEEARGHFLFWQTVLV